MQVTILGARMPLPMDEIEAFCRKWKVAEFRLSGSVLRDDFGPESDIDVLVTFLPDAGHTLFELAEMEDELAGIMGRKVDLVEREGVEQSENYPRRRSILSGEPTRDRDEAYLPDMLLAARQLRLFSDQIGPGESQTESLLRAGILYEVGALARAAGCVSERRRGLLPAIPWEELSAVDRIILPRSVPFFSPRIRHMVTLALPRLIDVLDDVVPPEESLP